VEPRIVLDNEVDGASGIVIRLVDSLGREIDRFEVANGLLCGQVLLSTSECPFQGCLEAALHPEGQVVVPAEAFFQQKDAFEDNNADVLEGDIVKCCG